MKIQYHLVQCVKYRRQWALNNLKSEFHVFPWGKPEWISYTDQQDGLPEIKQKYPRYTCVYSKVLQMVLRTLDADYKSFIALRRSGDRAARPPGFKGRDHFTTMIYNQSGFRVQDGRITLAQYYRKGVPLVFDGEFYVMHFFLWIIALTAFRLLSVWIYNRSNSLLLAQLTHASFTGSQLVFGPQAVSAAESVFWYMIFIFALCIVVAVIVIKEKNSFIYKIRSSK